MGKRGCTKAYALAKYWELAIDCTVRLPVKISHSIVDSVVQHGFLSVRKFEGAGPRDHGRRVVLVT